jgi:hypothetical protein
MRLGDVLLPAVLVTAGRRERGRLRTVGATIRRLCRRMLGEVLAVGVLATLPGGLTGALIAAPLARWLARAGPGAGVAGLRGAASAGSSHPVTELSSGC